MCVRIRSKVDVLLIILVILSTIVSYTSLVGRSIAEVERASAPEPYRVNHEAQSIVIAPNIIRYVTVHRADGSLETYVKENDPPTLHWYRLVANWMFALYDRTNYQGQNLRQPVLTITGANNPWFDNAMCGSVSLRAYFSNTTAPISFNTHNVSPLFTGKTTEYEVTLFSADTSNASHYRATISSALTYYGTQHINLTVALVTLISSGEVLFLIDRLEPPITLRPNEAVNVTWEVTFPKQPPYTDTFWTVLRNFLGLSNGPPDFGGNYYWGGCGRTLTEDLRIYFMRDSTVLSSSSFSGNTITVLGVGVESDGLYIRLRASYTPTAATTVNRIAIVLYADSNTGSATSGADYYILSFPIGPINLAPNQPLIVEVMIRFANLFS